MTDREGEGMSTNESITKELRQWASDRRGNAIADRIDERFSRELKARQDEVDALRAKLDASIPMPLDADGVPIHLDDMLEEWGCIHSMTCFMTNGEVKWLVTPHDYLSGEQIPSECRHDAPKPESIDDVRRTVGRGYTYRDQDVLCAIDRAYACGRRDGAGERE